MNSRRLLQFFDERAARGEAMALATVIETGGSTYSKRGDMMLLGANNEFVGLLSGGCLEGDLAERSAKVIETGCATIVEFDLREDDELWGLGVGCEGTLRVDLQKISAEKDYQPFARVREILLGRQAASVTIAIGQEIVVTPPPALLILGAGADTEPLVNMVAELGWLCTVIDHRPAYVESRQYSETATVMTSETAKMSQTVALSDYDMALVMSHHLVSDRDYLRQLADSDIDYIGLLGPKKRRERLLADLGNVAKRLAGRLRSPAGIHLGLRGAGPIAVEILAEMQQFLAAQHADHLPSSVVS